MMDTFYRYLGYSGMGGWDPFWSSILFLLVAWSLVWKGMALWKAARLGSRNWFIALLIISTAGILDILYLYIFSKNAQMPKHDEEKVPMVQ